MTLTYKRKSRKIVSIFGSNNVLTYNLIKKLKSNYEINIYSRKTINNFKFAKKYQGDIKNYSTLLPLCNESQIIIYTLFINKSRNDNIKVIKNLISCINKSLKVKKLIIISSAAILAFNKNRILNENHKPEKLDEYQKIRFDIENLLIKKLDKGKKLIILRPTDIINFNNSKSSIHSIKSRLLQKGIKGIIYRFLLGHRTYNLVHIDDLANAIIFFVEKDMVKNYEIYNVTSDDEKNIFHKLSNSYRFSFILPKLFLENIFSLLFFYLKKPNPLRIYDNTKIKKNGFKFSFKLKDILYDNV